MTGFYMMGTLVVKGLERKQVLSVVALLLLDDEEEIAKKKSKVKCLGETVAPKKARIRNLW